MGSDDNSLLGSPDELGLHVKEPHEHLRSEVAIVTGITEATLGTASVVSWAELRSDYRLIRAGIERAVPGFEDYEQRSPSAARSCCRIPRVTVAPSPPPRARLTSQHRRSSPSRSHPATWCCRHCAATDQFNTTVYGLSDHRGIEGGRLVVMLNRRDLAAMNSGSGRALAPLKFGDGGAYAARQA